MHYLDPDSFEADGPAVSPEDVSALGHAFIPCLLNRRARPACGLTAVARLLLLVHAGPCPAARAGITGAPFKWHAGLGLQHPSGSAVPVGLKPISPPPAVASSYSSG